MLQGCFKINDRYDFLIVVQIQSDTGSDTLYYMLRYHPTGSYTESLNNNFKIRQDDLANCSLHDLNTLYILPRYNINIPPANISVEGRACFAFRPVVQGF